MKKVCVVTGTRAEYGLLKPVIERIYDDAELELQILVTGAHLSTEFGLTYKAIEKDGFKISKKIEMLLAADTPSGIVKSMGVELMGLSDALDDLKPDIMVVLGDRYEILMAASAAMIYRIPIAHIHGGEATEGLIDEAIRHSITKMSALHFAATKKYAERIIQLGEQPECVFNVGALGVENIRKLKLLSKEQVEESLEFNIDRDTIMVTFHPVTLEKERASVQFGELLEAIEQKKYRVIFTKANSDTDGRVINAMIDKYVGLNKDRSVAFTSLGQIRYLSVLQYIKMVVGNSSSGIIEVPSFNIPTIDIGDRQKGRIAAKSVIHCDANRESILNAMKHAEEEEFRIRLKNNFNPYEGEDTSLKIVAEIKKYLNEFITVKKSFYDLER